MRKLALIVVSMLGLVVALGAFLLVHDFDSPELGQSLLDKVGAATGVTMTARTFHLNLLRGLTLEGVEVKSEADGRTLHLTLDTLLFEHRLMALMSGTVAIDRVLFDRPVITIVEASDAGAPAKPRAADEAQAKPAPEAAPSPSSGPAASEERKLSLELKQLTIQDAKLSVTRKGEPSLELEGFTLNLREITFNPEARSLAAIAGAGDMALARAAVGATALSDARTNFKLANAAFRMPELAVTTEFGKLAASLTLDLNPAPFTYELHATGAAIDVNRLVGVPNGFGAGSLELDASGKGPAPGDATMRGSVKLAAGKLPDIKATQAVDKALGKNVLAGTPYKPTEAKFALNDGVLTLSPFRFESEHARVDLEGTAGLAGVLDVDLGVATPRDGLQIEGVGATVLDVLSDAAGWVPVPIHVSGTLEEPKVRPDSAALVAQAKTGTKREVKEAAHKAAGDAAKKGADALRRRIRN